MEFSFATDPRGRRLCEGIVRAMVFLYDLSPDQALALLNAAWRGQAIADGTIVFHETEWYWAERLANPNPYLEANHPEQIAWKVREDRAQCRLASLNRSLGAIWPNVPGEASMTEAEWLPCDDSERMLGFLHSRRDVSSASQLPPRPSDRKLRLFACCISRYLHVNDKNAPERDETCLLAIKEAERAADLGMTPARTSGPGGKEYFVDAPSSKSAASRAAACCCGARAGLPSGECGADLLREVLGNPFRPITRHPFWVTPDVSLLAITAYDQRALPLGTLDLARLAILADALEEAGCADEALLSHLRSPGLHVRGCWALDLILGKQ
jgi:hypothetical protein